MCFRPENSKIHTAKRNIAAYKFVIYAGKSGENNIYNSNILGFEYIENTLYKTPFFPEQIHIGHAYTKHGFHTYNTIDNICVNSVSYETPYQGDGIYIKCYIPKGAKYVFGRNGEFLCSQLVIGGVLTRETYNKIRDKKNAKVAQY